MNNSSDYQTEFKHDTDNLTIFTILIFSVCSILFIIAVCLVIFRFSKEEEYFKKVASQEPLKLKALHEKERELLSRSGPVSTEEGTVIFMTIDQAKQWVVKDYNK